MEQEKSTLTESEVPEESTTEPTQEIVSQTAEVSEHTTELVDESDEAAPNRHKPNVAGRSRWWLVYVITAGVLAVLTILLGLALGGFEESNPKIIVAHWADAFCIAGAFAVGFGLLVVASNGGAFDIFSYGAQTLFRMFKKDPRDHRYGGYYEYQEFQRSRKRSFWYMLIVGGVYLLVGIVLFIVEGQMEF